MIISEPFIWNKDHYAYHITERINIKSIIENGLIPNIGERSRQVSDFEEAIFFFDNINNVEIWMDKLYPETNKNILEVLRFNIKGRKWYSNHDGEDFYLKRRVETDKLEILRIYDENNIIVPFDDLIYVDNLNYRWYKLREYSVRR